MATISIHIDLPPEHAKPNPGKKLADILRTLADRVEVNPNEDMVLHDSSHRNGYNFGRYEIWGEFEMDKPGESG